GSLADMGHYSLWPVFQLFELDAPFAVESRPSHLCTRSGNVAVRIKNDYSFPAACTIRFQFAAKAARPPLDVFWYDGSMKPPTPDEWNADDKELEAEGMMFVGDKGKILAGFHGENPQIIPEKKTNEHANLVSGPQAGRRSEGVAAWIAACKGGKPTHG